MRWICIFGAVILSLSACSSGKGVGFDTYDAKPDKSAPSDSNVVQWGVLESIPRYQVIGVTSANDAASVLPYAKSPGSSVPARSNPDVRLRVITSGDQNWLVAETASGASPAAELLNTEATQRSGCLITGTQSVSAATVFILDCS